jgi:hypothetical protein
LKELGIRCKTLSPVGKILHFSYALCYYIRDDIISKEKGVMAVTRTYTGRFLDDGRFVPDGVQVKMPTQFQAVVRFLETDNAKVSLHRRQVSAVRRFLAAVDELKDEGDVMTDADWDDIANIRNETNTGLSQEIEL